MMAEFQPSVFSSHSPSDRLTHVRMTTSTEPQGSEPQPVRRMDNTSPPDSPPLSTTPRCSNIVPGSCSENSLIVREALLMNLPQHLVLQTVQTSRTDYTHIKELVADMFTYTNRSRSGQDQEVPMETNQLEEVLMMNSPVVKKALRAGAPPHLIKPAVRTKILSNGVGYTDASELLKDLDY